MASKKKRNGKKPVGMKRYMIVLRGSIVLQGIIEAINNRLVVQEFLVVMKTHIIFLSLFLSVIYMHMTPFIVVIYFYELQKLMELNSEIRQILST